MENLSRISQMRSSGELPAADRQSTQTLLATVFEICRIINASGVPTPEPFLNSLLAPYGLTFTEAAARLGQFNPVVTPVPPPLPLLRPLPAPILYASEIGLAAPAALGSSAANPVVIEDADPAPAPTQGYQGSMAEQIFDDTDLEREAVLTLEAMSQMQLHHRTKFQEPGALNSRKHFSGRIEEKEAKKPKRSVEESKAELSESEESPPKMKLRRGQRVRRVVKDFSPSREEGVRRSSVVVSRRSEASASSIGYVPITAYEISEDVDLADVKLRCRNFRGARIEINSSGINLPMPSKWRSLASEKNRNPERYQILALGHIIATGEQYPDMQIVETERAEDGTSLGKGVIATADIPAETWVGSYLGEIKIPKEGEDNSYFFNLAGLTQSKYVIDAKEKGNITRFFNSDEENPNLDTYVVFDSKSGLNYICFKTTRLIKAGENLHISYGADYFRHLGIEPKQVRARN